MLNHTRFIIIFSRGKEPCIKYINIQKELHDVNYVNLVSKKKISHGHINLS